MFLALHYSHMMIKAFSCTSSSHFHSSSSILWAELQGRSLSRVAPSPSEPQHALNILHFRKIWLPSSFSLWQTGQHISRSTPSLMIFIPLARLLCVRRQTNILICWVPADPRFSSSWVWQHCPLCFCLSTPPGSLAFCPSAGPPACRLISPKMPLLGQSAKQDCPPSITELIDKLAFASSGWNWFWTNCSSQPPVLGLIRSATFDGPAANRVLGLWLSPARIQGSSQAMMLPSSPTLQTSPSFSRETPFRMLRRVCEIHGTLKKLVDNSQSKVGRDSNIKNAIPWEIFGPQHLPASEPDSCISLNPSGASIWFFLHTFSFR
jgi:hypothetical protein